MSQFVLDKLKERFAGAILETHARFGDDTALVDPSQWRAVCAFLHDDPELDFDMPIDLCGVDYPDRGKVGGARDGRMEVVMHLYSVSKRHRVRLKARVGDEDMEGAELDSVTSIWPGMDWLEREVFDMSGVRFRGHPDLRRILMYPEFKGHPLQRTYPADLTQPLVEYRTEEEAGLPLHKIEPFGPEEGMPFGRMTGPPLATNVKED
ncbi:MAG: NADH-quinone oxidoreductase subunit C [Myxococcota bacterium]|nr:NADH-quinone oxidoreductase subunit C [Myxococcota bacterium]